MTAKGYFLVWDSLMKDAIDVEYLDKVLCYWFAPIGMWSWDQNSMYSKGVIHMHNLNYVNVDYQISKTAYMPYIQCA